MNDETSTPKYTNWYTTRWSSGEEPATGDKIIVITEKIFDGDEHIQTIKRTVNLGRDWGHIR